MDLGVLLKGNTRADHQKGGLGCILKGSSKAVPPRGEQKRFLHRSSRAEPKEWPRAFPRGVAKGGFSRCELRRLFKWRPRPGPQGEDYDVPLAEDRGASSNGGKNLLNSRAADLSLGFFSRIRS